MGAQWPIKIHIAGSYGIIGDSLYTYLKAMKFPAISCNEYLDVVADSKELLERMDMEIYPHMLLLNADIKPMDGVELVRYFRRKYPVIRIVVYTTEPNNWKALEMLKAGAHDILPLAETSLRVGLLLMSVRNAPGLDPSDYRKYLKEGLEDEELPVLDMNEMKFIKLCAEALSLEDIEAEMRLPRKEILDIERHLCIKFGVNYKNRVDLVAIAVRAGLIELEYEY